MSDQHTPGRDGDGRAPDRGALDGRARRAEVRQTLERARAAIRASLDAHAHGQTVLTRAAALREDADRARQESAARRTELREAVRAYVRDLRDEGQPPQRMLVLVKSAVRDSTPLRTEPLEARQELTADVVRWSVEAYYETAPPA